MIMIVKAHALIHGRLLRQFVLTVPNMIVSAIAQNKTTINIATIVI